MHVQPYLYFDGRCEEAIEFYKGAIGAEVNMMLRFKDGPDTAMIPPGGAEKIMHGQFIVGATTIMCSDGHCGGKPTFQGVSLNIQADDDAQAERLFAALGEGGQVQMPMTSTFFASRFGMVADRFGVSWMVIAYPK